MNKVNTLFKTNKKVFLIFSIFLILFAVIISTVEITLVINSRSKDSVSNTTNAIATTQTAVVSPEVIQPDEKEITAYNEKYVGWNTYKSNMYDSSLKYPSSWKIDVTSMDLNCGFDQYLKNNESCDNKKADVITLTKGDKNSSKFMSINFAPFIPHKGCEGCRTKSYPFSTINRGGYSADFFLFNGEVQGLSYVSYSGSTNSSDKLLGIIPGKNSKFIFLPTQLYYGKDINDLELEEELKILESIV